MTGENLLYLLI